MYRPNWISCEEDLEWLHAGRKSRDEQRPKDVDRGERRVHEERDEVLGEAVADDLENGNALLGIAHLERDEKEHEQLNGLDLDNAPNGLVGLQSRHALVCQLLLALEYRNHDGS